uniref:Uncharacterized protein n=1 Tax=Oryza punctata TaxID=4537 RepID=A0A0E0LGA0_ORYPU
MLLLESAASSGLDWSQCEREASSTSPPLRLSSCRLAVLPVFLLTLPQSQACRRQKHQTVIMAPLQIRLG